MIMASKSTHRWCLGGLAMVALVGMMVAPLCGPLCAGSFCTRSAADGPAGTVGCHGDQPSGNDSHARLDSQKSCTAPEFPSATLNKDETNLRALKADTRSAPPIRVPATVQAAFASRIADEHWHLGLTSPHLQRRPAVSGVLLI